MAKWCLRIIEGLPGFIFMVLMAAAGISPRAAASNISAWADLLHIPVPDAVKNKTADVVIFWLCLFLLVLYIIILVFLYKQQRESKKQPIVTIDKYFSGGELLQRWNIKDFQLLDCINDGLIPYNQQQVPIPIKIANHLSLSDGFLNSINRLPTNEELKGIDLKAIEYYADTLFSNHFLDTKEILKHLPKYFIEYMLQKTQEYFATKKNSDEEKLVHLLKKDITITIDLEKPEQLKQLCELIFIEENVKAQENKRNKKC